MKQFFQKVWPVCFLWVALPTTVAELAPTAMPTPPETALIQAQPISLEQARENLRERRQEVRTEIQQRQTTTRVQATERTKKQVRLLFGRMIARMEAAVSRLERLIARIEARLSKMEDEDVQIDTAAVRKTLDQAKDDLVEADAALSQAKTSLEDILSAASPKEAFTDLRALIREIKEQLVAIHRSLAQIIGRLKGLRVGQGS